MVNRKWLLGLLLFAVLVQLSGCYPGTGTDNLLVPPKLTAEQDKIYQALEKRRAATLISDIRRLENTDLPLFYAILMMSR